jgi:hypothetical protein
MTDNPGGGTHPAGRVPYTRGRRIAEVIGFLVLWLIAVEIVLRLFFASPARIVHDAALGWHYAPNTSFLMPDQDSGYRRLSTNALGLNNPPIGPKAGRKRVVVLGDSYVEAVQLPRRASFIGILRHDEPAYDFVNLGRSGLDPLDEEVYFAELAPKLQPDGAIMVVNFRDQYDILGTKLRVVRCGSAICDYRLAGEQRSASRELLNRIESYSALATFLAQKYQAFLQGPRIDIIDRAAALFKKPSAKAAGPSVQRSDLEPLLVSAFGKVTKQVPLLVVYIPTLAYEPGGKVSAPLANGWKEIVEGAAKRSGTTFLDMGPPFAQVYANTGQPPVGYDFNRVGLGHPNYAGHAAIAEAIKRHLDAFSREAAGK